MSFNVNKPIDKINIGYNKNRDEYIELLEEKNKIKKEIEKSKEHQDKRKIQEKEQGFNIHINGANEERIREQRKQEMLKGQRAHSKGEVQQQDSQKVRRMWKNPNSVEGRQQESQEGHPKYHNPFDLGVMDSSKEAGKGRKRWGEQASFGSGNQPTKAIHQDFQKNEEEDYSDSFEDIQYEPEEEEQEGQNDIEKFLRTATMKDINDLRQSMSNFGVKAGQLGYKMGSTKKDNKQQEDDYIEEEFEELIESAEDDDSEEEKKFEEQRRVQQQQQVLVSKNVAAKNAKNRPISATFNLESAKIQKHNEPQPLYSAASKQQLPIVREKTLQIQNTNQIDKSYHPPNPVLQETPKQPHDFMKKPMNTNPFKRPFSQNIGKRPEPEEAKSLPNKTTDTAFTHQSQKVNISTILNKIEQLDEWQKEKLMDILENLDSYSQVQASQQFESVSSYNKPNIDLNFLSPKTEQKEKIVSSVQASAKNLNFGQESNRNELIIRVLKTYGNPHLCGLTEVELFDNMGKKINLVQASIQTRNLGSGPKLSLGKLIDGHKLTNDEKHMWIGYLPRPPLHLELVIQLQKDQQIGGFKIWNYNKSSIDCTKGVKDIEIVLNENVIWQGTLESGRGSVTTEYATFIQINEHTELPREIKEVKKDIIEQAIEEQYEEEEETGKAKDQDMGEELRKYRSEAQMKQRPESTPFWLSGDNKRQQNKQEIQDQKQANDKAGQQTFDLLDKYSAKESAVSSQQYQSTRAQSQVQSAVGASRPHPLRDTKEGGSQQQSTSSLIKPNAALGQISASNKQKPVFEMGSQGNKQWTQPFNPQKQGQLQETSEAIKNAVNKVNMIMSQQTKNVVHKPQKVEESLDNLEFFKATNLGRLESEVEEGQHQNKEKTGTRAKWVQSPGKGLQDSQLSSASKHKSAHVVVKNPFPVQQKGPQTQRKNITFQEEQNDILDQFLGKEQKKQQIKTERVVNQQAQKDPIHHLQIAPSDALKHASKQASVSPAREPIVRKELTFDDKLKLFSETFMIPSLPSGQKIHINILSTWGDMNYVGLTGIEVFDIEGKQVKIGDTNISSFPPDINILPGYGGDPRTIDKLIDGNYFTNDDLHVWLAPFTAGEDHTISIDLGKKYQVSMIRIWNYNKNRIHSYRGARLITCELDNKMIFRGELKKAPGNLNDPENCCEMILFTENEAILQRIDFNDWINEKTIQSSMEDTQRITQDVPSYLDERPMTATKKFNTAEIEEIQRQLKQQVPTSLFDERPQTSAIITGDQEEAKYSSKTSMSKKHQNLLNQVKQGSNYSEMKSNGLKGKVLYLNILDTWGDLFYVGLTGIEIYDDKGQIIPVDVKNVTANPRDMNAIPGHGSDYRTLDKLFNRNNNTMDDHNMWLIPFNKGENHTINIDFGKTITLGSIRFFNYNKSEEDTLRGVRQIVMQLDKKYITPRKGITLRKGPGLVHPLFNLGQEVKLPLQKGWTTDQIVPINRKCGDLGLFQEYELMNLPIGYMFKINLYSTHGDFYYIGLNGIELFDQNGYVIRINNVFAEPLGVHTIKGMEGDVRQIQNLINNKNQTFEEQNMWLAPFKNTRSYSAATQAQTDQSENTDYRIPNYLYIVFDEPKAISAVKLWNYAKTPSRGVNEFELLIDDKQVYRGFAKAAPEKAEYDRAMNKDFSTVVLFTSEDKIVEKFQGNVNYDPTKQQSVLLVNEKKVMNMNESKGRTKDNFVVFNDMQRPTTMAKRM